MTQLRFWVEQLAGVKHQPRRIGLAAGAQIAAGVTERHRPAERREAGE